MNDQPSPIELENELVIVEDHVEAIQKALKDDAKAGDDKYAHPGISLDGQISLNRMIFNCELKIIESGGSSNLLERAQAVKTKFEKMCKTRYMVTEETLLDELEANIKGGEVTHIQVVAKSKDSRAHSKDQRTF